MEFHEIANLFPMIGEDDLQRLADDIKTHGLLQPIITYENKILDGRNRYSACIRAGVTPRFEPWTGTGSPVAYVLSTNLHRRHLTESQRGMVAAKAKTLFKKDADDRMRAGVANPTPNLGEGINRHAGESAEQAAKLLNVSRGTVQNASKVLSLGTEELKSAVMAGKVAVSNAAVIASAPNEKQREIVAKGEKEIIAAAKEIRNRKLAERREERVEKLVQISGNNAPITGDLGTFPIIYADPPWRYEHVETENRAIENQYPTMELEDICRLPVSDIATPDAVLFMWATSPKLEEAFRVLNAWGFTYRTCAVWAKPQLGMGYYFRQKHELLLVCTRGNPPTPKPADRPGSVITADRTKHSAKPEEFYEAIEKMYPEFKKIELFCRSARKGWNVWGNQS